MTGKVYGCTERYILLYLEDMLNPGIRSDVGFFFFKVDYVELREVMEGLSFGIRPL